MPIRRMLLLSAVLLAPISAQSTYQLYKSCKFGSNKYPSNERCEVTNTRDTIGIVEHVAVVCGDTARLTSTFVRSKTAAGKVDGSHGIPIAAPPSQAAGNVKLVVQPKGSLELAISGSDGFPNTCAFTAVLTQVK